MRMLMVFLFMVGVSAFGVNSHEPIRSEMKPHCYSTTYESRFMNLAQVKSVGMPECETKTEDGFQMNYCKIPVVLDQYVARQQYCRTTDFWWGNTFIPDGEEKIHRKERKVQFILRTPVFPLPRKPSDSFADTNSFSDERWMSTRFSEAKKKIKDDTDHLYEVFQHAEKTKTPIDCNNLVSATSLATEDE